MTYFLPFKCAGLTLLDVEYILATLHMLLSAFIYIT